MDITTRTRLHRYIVRYPTKGTYATHSKTTSPETTDEPDAATAQNIIDQVIEESQVCKNNARTAQVEIDPAEGKVDSSAVIVHWGSIELTKQAALDLLATGAFSKLVIVANDGSECPRGLEENGIRWAKPGRNLGFGAGCQFGARLVRARKYAFFNPDAQMKARDISLCLSALEVPSIGVAGPVLVNPSGSLQSGCGSISRWFWSSSATEDPRESQEPLVDCMWVTGAAIFCREEVVWEVEWDGSYFLLSEDVDLCLRTRRRGWRVVIVRDAVGVHPGGTSIEERKSQYYSARNRIWMARRLAPTMAQVLVTLSEIRWIPRIVLADIVGRRQPRSYYYVRGILAGVGPIPNEKIPIARDPIPIPDWTRPRTNHRRQERWKRRSPLRSTDPHESMSN